MCTLTGWYSIQFLGSKNDCNESWTVAFGLPRIIEMLTDQMLVTTAFYCTANPCYTASVITYLIYENLKIPFNCCESFHPRAGLGWLGPGSHTVFTFCKIQIYLIFLPLLFD